jgi:hypothetical protein
MREAEGMGASVELSIDKSGVRIENMNPQPFSS